MKVINLLLYISLITNLLLIISCDYSNEIKVPWNKNYFNNFLVKNNIQNDELVLIPGSGCRECINKMHQFIIENASSTKQTTYIFTSLDSPKMLNLQLGDQIIALPNILIDKDNSIFLKSIYPVYITLNQNSALEFKELKYFDIKFPLSFN